MEREEFERLLSKLASDAESSTARGSGSAELQRVFGNTKSAQKSTDHRTASEIRSLLAAFPMPQAPQSDSADAVAALAAAQRNSVQPSDMRLLPQAKAPSNASGGNIGTQVLKTVGLLTGTGPLVTGLLSLFGRGSSERPEQVDLPIYDLPQAIQVSAGLQADRSVTGVSYGAGDQIRPARTDTPTNAGPVIQVNVQAMDSRSFLDHSSDIAAAVRKAVLHSNALNDVVSEL